MICGSHGDVFKQGSDMMVLCFIKIMLMAVKELVRGEKSIQEVIVQSRIPISGSRKGKEQTDMKAI